MAVAEIIVGLIGLAICGFLFLFAMAVIFAVLEFIFKNFCEILGGSIAIKYGIGFFAVVGAAVQESTNVPAASNAYYGKGMVATAPFHAASSSTEVQHLKETAKLMAIREAGGVGPYDCSFSSCCYYAVPSPTGAFGPDSIGPPGRRYRKMYVSRELCEWHTLERAIYGRNSAHSGHKRLL